MSTQHLDEEPPLQGELTWGLSYRDWRQSEEPVVIPPKHSPINMPFELCRAMQQLKKKSKKRSRYTSTSSGDVGSKSQQAPKLSLEERSALPQDRYMELLSIPNYCPPKKKRSRKKKICCKCNTTFLCRPRLFQMAIPNKRYVWENWKAYQHFLPAEMLMRFDRILKSGDNLEPSIARCYFKQLQKEKRERKKRLKKKKKLSAEQEAKRLLNAEVDELADVIVQFVKKQPLFVLNFQQMMTSNELLRFFSVHKLIKVGKRTTKDPFKKATIEISDKLVVWIDKVTSYVDIQPLDSREQMGPMEMPSMESLIEEISEEEEGEGEFEGEDEGFEGEGEFEGEDLTISEREEGEGEGGEGEGGEGEGGEGEGEEEEGEEGEGGEGEPGTRTDKGKKDRPRGKGEDNEEEEEEAGESFEEESSEEEGKTADKSDDKGGEEGEAEERFDAEKIVDKAKIFNQYEDEGSLMDMLEHLDEDILEKLIQILSASPPEYLAQQILPNITYGDILTKLKQIRDGNLMDPERQKLLLEEKMIEWAKKNEPDQVDDKVLNKIHETALILGEWFKDANLVGDVSKDEAKERARSIGDEEGEEGSMGGEEGDDRIGDERKSKQIGEAGEEKAGEGEEAGEGGETGGEEAGGEEAGEGEDAGEGENAGEGEDTGERVVSRSPRPTKGSVKGGGVGSAEEEEEEEEEEEGEGRAPGKEEGIAGSESEAGEETEGEWGEGVEDEEEGEGGESMEGEEGEGFQEGEGYGQAEEGEDEEDGRLGGLADELEKLDSLLKIIKHHNPSEVFDHASGTICCLSLKVWAVWLLEIANNAHNWTKWTGDIIRQVRHYAAIIRGDVTTPSGERQVLYKEQWRKFVNDTEEKVIAWRQYSKHVKDLSDEIMENFHEKPVTCCPKCLQDHLIKDVVTAHETMQAMAEAINCADYWQRCLDRIVEQTSKFAEIDVEEEEEVKVEEAASEESYVEIEELQLHSAASDTSYASLLEIEELELQGVQPPAYEILELSNRPNPQMYEIEALQEPEVTDEPPAPEQVKSEKSEVKGKKKGKKAAKKR